MRKPSYGTDEQRSCTNKDAYPSEAHARSVALMNGMQSALHTYECRYCGMWHLTRRRPETDDTADLWE